MIYRNILANYFDNRDKSKFFCLNNELYNQYNVNSYIFNVRMFYSYVLETEIQNRNNLFFCFFLYNCKAKHFRALRRQNKQF